ncbi:MAG TPA: RsiV family protein [Anaerolineales bacterium]|jgi:hypothetical protein|nr:RsiV family protein [Anaerolineales bacterium]
MRPILRKSIALSPVFLFILACVSITPAVPTATPTPARTQTQVPLSQQLTLTSKPISEEVKQSGKFPDYKITAQIPQLTGGDDPHVQELNQRLNDLVQGQVDMWRQDFQQLPLTSLSNGSFLDASYKLIFQRGDIWSFKFDFSFYADTAAHPGLNSETLNYDLAQGKKLTLDNLFLPNSNYLETISAYCITDLKRRNPGFDDTFLQGANPTPENYRNWNITSNGLLITFDEYQVAPYAAGPQAVTIPYSELKSIIDPSGPLVTFIK